MILGLFGCLLQHGGIERAGRLTGAALTNMARSQGQPCSLLSLNDAPGIHTFTVDGLQCSCIGFGRHKTTFVMHALRVARRARVVFLGHVNLAPIGHALRLANPGLRYWVATYGVEVWEPLRGLRRQALRRADGIIAPSRYTAEQLVKVQCLDPSRVAILPCCLEPGFTDGELNASAPEASGSGCILTVGRLLGAEPGKGIDTVLHALPKVLQAVPSARYVVIGDGDLRPHLEQLAKKLGVSSSVSFLGHQNEEALRGYYTQSDVFVMPSRQEGFGIVFLEAMGFGKPVIAAEFGGARDIVIDGLTGYLIEYGDVNALENYLISILRDTDLRKRMGAAGRERLNANYTFGHFRQRLAELLV